MFTEGLEIAFGLTVDGTAYEVPGSQVKNFSLEITPYGFEAEVDFWISLDNREDIFFTFFTGHGLITAALTMKAYPEPEGDQPPDALVVTGLVTDKRLFEETYPDLENAPVKYRRYSVRFADKAKVLWTQHHPTELYVDQTVKSVLDAHKGEATFECTLPAANDSHNIVFLPLGVPGSASSFYDFVQHYAASQNAVFTYDSATLKYKLAADKGAVANAGVLSPHDVEQVEIVFPETPRYNLHVLNALAEDPVKEEGTQDNVVGSLRRDVVLRESVASAFTAEKTLHQKGFVTAPVPLVELTFGRFPTITLRPGTYLDFSHGDWGTAVYPKGTVYRVRSLSIQSFAVEQSHYSALYTDRASYDMEVSAVLETSGDVSIPRPPFNSPRYPVLVEGKVVSEEGAEAEETYQIYANADTSVDQHKVKIPLWNDKMVVVDFNANMMPGHFYFPCFKDARVLVALHQHRAWIKRFLDWRPGARLPADSQGNHLLLGKKAKDQTSISHTYVDEKPVLAIKRCLDKDTELIHFEEGILILQTKEEK